MTELKKMRIANHQCSYCGKALPIDEKRKTCDECREKMNSTYSYFTNMGICGICKANRVTKGYKTCVECREKARDRMHGKKTGNLEKREKSRVRLLNERRANGICTHCGRFKTYGGKAYCERCLTKIKNKRLEIRLGVNA